MKKKILWENVGEKINIFRDFSGIYFSAFLFCYFSAINLNTD